eukprot:SAG25_NODE_1067_length_4136_cov_2.734209_3_plen_86_part_00
MRSATFGQYTYVELDSEVIEPLRCLLAAKNVTRDLRRRAVGYDIHMHGGGRGCARSRYVVGVECLLALLDQEWAQLHRGAHTVHQ